MDKNFENVLNSSNEEQERSPNKINVFRNNEDLMNIEEK